MALYLLSILLFYGISTTRAVNISQNIAYGRPTEQSSTGWGGSSDRAVDGNTDGYYGNKGVTHTQHSRNPWWKVSLKKKYNIAYIQVFNRKDCCSDRLANFIVQITDDNSVVWTYRHKGIASLFTHIVVPTPVLGNGVKVSLEGREYLSLAEVQVQEVIPPASYVREVAGGKTTWQSSTAWGGSSSRAVDGSTSGYWLYNGVTHTKHSYHPWWKVHLRYEHKIAYIQVFNRVDCCSDRLVNFRVRIAQRWSWVHVFTQTGHLNTLTTIDLGQPVLGDVVEVSLYGLTYLSLAEVKVYGTRTRN